MRDRGSNSLYYFFFFKERKDKYEADEDEDITR